MRTFMFPKWDVSITLRKRGFIPVLPPALPPPTTTIHIHTPLHCFCKSTTEQNSIEIKVAGFGFMGLITVSLQLTLSQKGKTADMRIKRL